MSIRLARPSALALLLIAGLALAAPALAAPRTPPADGWLGLIRGGLERLFGAEGGCIDPNGAKCSAQPTTSGHGVTGVIPLPAAATSSGAGPARQARISPPLPH